MELTNAINWFEVPATDFDRAKAFYETIFDYQMPENNMGKTRMGFFLYDFKSGKVGGAICCGDGYQPSATGALIYLNCNPDLREIIERVEKAGGKILIPKTPISPEGNLGFIAQIIDTEGNRIALHSMS